MNIKLKPSQCEWPIELLLLNMKICKGIEFLFLLSISVLNGTKVSSQMNSWQNWRTLNRRIVHGARNTTSETVEDCVRLQYSDGSNLGAVCR